MNLKLSSALVLISAAILVLSGCSSISAGAITEKNHTQSWTQIISTTSCTTVGKTTVCSPHIYSVYHPESWEFDLRAGKKDGYAYVSEDTYAHYNVGDYYNDKR